MNEKCYPRSVMKKFYFHLRVCHFWIYWLNVVPRYIMLNFIGNIEFQQINKLSKVFILRMLTSATTLRWTVIMPFQADVSRARFQKSADQIDWRTCLTPSPLMLTLKAGSSWKFQIRLTTKGSLVQEEALATSPNKWRVSNYAIEVRLPPEQWALLVKG